MDEPVERACFPDSGIVSVVCVSEGGESVEIGMVGYEGVAGLNPVLGDGVPHNRRVVVQVAGGGWMIEADALRGEFQRGGHFQDVLLRYGLSLQVPLSLQSHQNVALPHDTLRETNCEAGLGIVRQERRGVIMR